MAKGSGLSADGGEEKAREALCGGRSLRVEHVVSRSRHRLASMGLRISRELWRRKGRVRAPVLHVGNMRKMPLLGSRRTAKSWIQITNPLKCQSHYRCVTVYPYFPWSVALAPGPCCMAMEGCGAASAAASPMNLSMSRPDAVGSRVLGRGRNGMTFASIGGARRRSGSADRGVNTKPKPIGGWR